MTYPRISGCLAVLCLLLSCGLRTAAQTTPTPQWRPAYHFTPPQNWTNDPNGLFYQDGTFHLYYQHNPFENKWGHMSWGHATSRDLVRWQHLPVAIPERVTPDTTTWIFSGCAVVDTANTSGFSINGKAPVVAIFTAHLPKQKKECQYLAYSNDNGNTYTLYDHNPIIDLDMADFRDPNVFWYAPTKSWVMTVALVNEHQVRFYGSKDLKHWEKLSDFGPAGYTKNGWECPSLLRLPVAGSKEEKWVLFVSCFQDHGPLMQYYTGSFDGKQFHNDNTADKALVVDYGDAFYAAIAWRDAPQRNPILLGWIQNGRPETYPWKGQMSIPQDLSLYQGAEGLRLRHQPAARVVKTLPHYTSGQPLVQYNPASKPVKDTMVTVPGNNGNAYWLTASFAVNAASTAGFNVLENKQDGRRITVGYDAVKATLFVDCTASEKQNKSPENLVMRAPMKPVNGMVQVQILVDRSSLEVFGNNGEQVISTMVYPAAGDTGISWFTTNNALLKKLELRNIQP